jgi:hypothetical protein
VLYSNDMSDEQAAEEAARLEKEDRASALEAARAFRNSHRQEAPATQPRPSKACDSYQKLKKGCDRGLPSCSKCKSRGCACVYSRG